MSKDRLGRLYDRLTPEERFKLDVEATARGDEEESRRLTETCPRHNYIMNDWEFVGRWQAMRELAMLIYMDLARCLNKIQMIEAFREMLPYLRTVWQNDTHSAYFDGHLAGSYHAWRTAVKEGEPPGWETDDKAAECNADPAMDGDLEKWSGKVEEIHDRLTGALEKLEGELAAQGLVVWSAFADFCAQEIGLEAGQVLEALAPPFTERAQRLEDMAERLEVEPDAESVEQYRAIMEEAWRRSLAKG